MATSMMPCFSPKLSPHTRKSGARKKAKSQIVGGIPKDQKTLGDFRQ
jgi:hypothetical protein